MPYLGAALSRIVGSRWPPFADPRRHRCRAVVTRSGVKRPRPPIGHGSTRPSSSFWAPRATAEPASTSWPPPPVCRPPRSTASSAANRSWCSTPSTRSSATPAGDSGRGAGGPSQGDLRQALADVLSAVVDAVLRQPEAARLAVVDIAALGPSGLQRRRALTDGLQELLRRAATTGDGLTVLSEPALGVLAGGTLHVLDRHLRSGRMRPLRSAALDLATWGAMYETDAPRPAPARRPLRRRHTVRAPPLSQGLPHGRHGLPAAFVAPPPARADPRGGPGTLGRAGLRDHLGP